MSPEHFDGHTDQRSDIYAMGIILFQMACGRYPYRSTNWEYAHRSGPVPTIVGPFASIVHRALAKDPDGRYQSFGEMRRDLEAVYRILAGNEQSIPGHGIDDAIGQLLLELMSPVTLDVALAVQEELQSRLEEADLLRKQQMERARYEADLAQQRYVQVDPRNRLVADALEADWNEKLRGLREQEEQYEQHRQADRAIVDEKVRQEILSLATDFPRLWRSPKTSDRQRKQMVRLLIEDVTLSRAEKITAHIRYKGGATRTLLLPIPPSAWQARLTRPEAIEEIDRLLDEYTDAEIAVQLDQRGLRSGTGGHFTRLIVGRLRREYGLKSRYDRLRERGMLTEEEIAEELDIHVQTVRRWSKRGLLKAHPYSDKHECLYEPVGEQRPIKHHGIKLTDPRRFGGNALDRTDEVQDEA